jgi:hypothetical protein
VIRLPFLLPRCARLIARKRTFIRVGSCRRFCAQPDPQRFQVDCSPPEIARLELFCQPLDASLVLWLYDWHRRDRSFYRARSTASRSSLLISRRISSL